MDSPDGQPGERQPLRRSLRAAAWVGVLLVAILWGCLAIVITELPNIGNEHPDDAGFPIGGIMLYSFLTGAPAAALVKPALRGMGSVLGVSLGLMWVAGVVLLVVGWATCC